MSKDDNNDDIIEPFVGALSGIGLGNILGSGLGGFSIPNPVSMITNIFDPIIDIIQQLAQQAVMSSVLSSLVLSICICLPISCIICVLITVTMGTTVMNII